MQQRVGRATYWKLRLLPIPGAFLLMAIVIAIFPKSIGAPIVAPLALFFAGWLFFGGILSRWLLPLFVSTLTCPDCGEEIEAVDVWQCSCGYQDHRERNILAMRCPKCGERSGHVDCPRCSATILLWHG